MNGSVKIQPAHRQRQGVVYVRQSDPRQVIQHQESTRNQRALRERLLELGWSTDQIVIIDEDQGITAKHSAGREGFQQLAADVGLGKVGIILGYEVSRLSRNNADWHRLLELCAVFDTLIGDTDGIYQPRDFNDRLLLGLKGTMSEAELHSLHLRLDAGRVSKAKRGELVQHLPTGYVRDADGAVTFDPNIAIQNRIRMVFEKFRELGTAHKVLSYLVNQHLKMPRRQTSGLYAGQVLWKDATSAALLSILKNPAYAGAFAYGRRQADPTRQVPGRPATGRTRRPQDQWQALVMDVYPAYITWDEHERIQRQIAENEQRMQDRLVRKQAIRKGAALLTGLVRCTRCGHAMHVSYKENRFQYICNHPQRHYKKSTCQHVSGMSVDEVVVEEFFNAIKPAQIDALQKVIAKEAKNHRQTLKQLEQEVVRLEYEAKRAERQYDNVDPENRLIAASLEKKWEAALIELQRAQAKRDEVKKANLNPRTLSQQLRAAFADVGRQLPQLWPELAVEAKKSLVRVLIANVNLLRSPDGMVQIRIAWRGGLVTERSIRTRVHTLRHSATEKRIVERLRELSDEGQDNEQIAEALNDEGFIPSRGERFTRQIVTKLKACHRIVHNREKARRGEVTSAYTASEIAKLVNIDPSWLYRHISAGVIRIEKDPRYRCYLFPRNRRTIDLLSRLKRKEVSHVTIPKVH